MAYEANMHGEGEAMRKGPWLQEEDDQLTAFVTCLGGRRWDSLAKVAGLRRSGKSCRLLWLSYLRPNLKHGPFSVEEEQLILLLQQQWSNKWSKIALRLPGRTDNEIKNYWRTHLRKISQVQQQEFQHKLENSAQDVFCQKSTDTVSQDHSHMNLDSQESEFRTKYSSFDVLPLSDKQLTRSPYETRIFDWIADFQIGYSETLMEDEHESNGTGSYQSYASAGFVDDCDTWDYSGSLWEMN